MPEFSRRQFFRLRLAGLTREAGKAVAADGRAAGSGGEAEEGQRWPRPPGALRDDEAFLNACDRCHLCSGACPHDAIDHFGPAHGRLEGTPFIDPAKAPCHWCEDMPCISACPSGALSRAEGERVAPIATVSLDFEHCLNAQGILCDTCSYRCPSHVRAIRMVNRRPVLDASLCTGCGMCLYHCDADPGAFHFALVHESAHSPAASGQPPDDLQTIAAHDFQEMRRQECDRRQTSPTLEKP